MKKYQYVENSKMIDDDDGTDYSRGEELEVIVVFLQKEIDKLKFDNDILNEKLKADDYYEICEKLKQADKKSDYLKKQLTHSLDLVIKIKKIVEGKKRKYKPICDIIDEFDTTITKEYIASIVSSDY